MGIWRNHVPRWGHISPGTLIFRCPHSSPPFLTSSMAFARSQGHRVLWFPVMYNNKRGKQFHKVTTKLSMVTLISTPHTAQTNHANYIHSAFLAPQLLPSLVLICTHQSKHFCGWWPLLQFSKWLVLNAHFNITFLCCLPVTRCVPTTVLDLGTDADSVVLL